MYVCSYRFFSLTQLDPRSRPEKREEKDTSIRDDETGEGHTSRHMWKVDAPTLLLMTAVPAQMAYVQVAIVYGKT